MRHCPRELADDPLITLGDNAHVVLERRKTVMGVR
jgi:hypothetical protein